MVQVSKTPKMNLSQSKNNMTKKNLALSMNNMVKWADFKADDANSWAVFAVPDFAGAFELMTGDICHSTLLATDAEMHGDDLDFAAEDTRVADAIDDTVSGDLDDAVDDGERIAASSSHRSEDSDSGGCGR